MERTSDYPSNSLLLIVLSNCGCLFVASALLLYTLPVPPL